MRVAVITPYCGESLEMLRHCHESVLEQTQSCTHFMIADGPQDKVILEWQAEHIILPRANGNNGNTPRGVGSLVAMNQGYDAIAYLDADNWFYPNHIESMIKLHHQTQSLICTATRSIHRTDGSMMYVDFHGSDGINHVDTSCLFLTKKAFGVLPLWAMMPHQLGPICDQVFWQACLEQGFSHSQHYEATVGFRTRYQVHYENMGEVPPPETKSIADTIRPAQLWWDQYKAGQQR